MYIGILVHSQTGHTFSVAQQIGKKLNDLGHTCKIERVNAVGETEKSRGQLPMPLKLLNPPDASPYDAVILGAPVWGFALSRVMAAYLDQLPRLPGRKAGCYVTQHLTNPLFGGNRSVKRLKETCRKKGAEVFATGIVHWSSDKREDQIQSLVDMFSQIG